MDVALVVNPTARSAARSDAAARAAARLRAHDIGVTVLAGDSALASSRLLRDALDAGVDAVMVAGGDGTVGLAVQELAGTGIPLAIVPTGTGNDAATALGLRERDPFGAADAVIGGATRRIDLARLRRIDGSTTLYSTVLASGFDSRVNDRANRMKWPRGHVRYDIAILVEFLRLRAIGFEIELESADGTGERLREDFIMATVGNGPTYGGGIPICPDALLDDGLLDVTLVRPLSRARLLRLLPRVYRGTHTDLPEVVTTRVRRVRLAAVGVTAYADGDPVGSLPLEIDVVPGALRVFTPSTEASAIDQ
ncbi:diacylglycerol kinase [Microbacterium sp. VKM Ac-2870]|uniref:diacylglycerol kinase n=1 Tax=Microbacterium sp. VKM Ac-2870 TaxID=2783825 RepID=UPI00188AAA0B|nr:diacylglycerol kinase [Microbacterium sp. VKM Ac-2870]MBF4561726.1 diacylglycerol kinase [Microbacterium sp. VKM Ac-2870]